MVKRECGFFMEEVFLGERIASRWELLAGGGASSDCAGKVATTIRGPSWQGADGTLRDFRNRAQGPIANVEWADSGTADARSDEQRRKEGGTSR